MLLSYNNPFIFCPMNFEISLLLNNLSFYMILTFLVYINIEIITINIFFLKKKMYLNDKFVGMSIKGQNFP